MPKLVNSRVSTTALDSAPMMIQGRYLPILVLVLSTMVPIIGSLTPSQMRASGVSSSKKPSFSPSTLDW